MDSESVVQSTLPGILGWKSLRGNVQCDHCMTNTEEVYACNACYASTEMGFDLCFTCIDRFGREAHAHRRGSSHTFQLVKFPIACNACARYFRQHDLPFLRCSKWQDLACRFDICGDCIKVHSNITNHTTREGPEHTFKVIDFHREAPPIQQPDPYILVQGEEIICSACKSRIHTEFFRCLQCEMLFDLCARCADEGEVAKHVVHNFTYLVVSHNHSHSSSGSKPQSQMGGISFSNRNNPESNR